MTAPASLPDVPSNPAVALFMRQPKHLKYTSSQ